MSLKKDKPDTPTTLADKYKAFLKAHLCTFQTAGRRCQMLGAHIDKGSEYRLCNWHWLNQSTPKLLQDYEEFVRYRNMDRQTYPKEWLHTIHTPYTHTQTHTIHTHIDTYAPYTQTHTHTPYTHIHTYTIHRTYHTHTHTHHTHTT